MRGFTLLLGVALILGALWGGVYEEHVLNPDPIEASAKVVHPPHWATAPLILTCFAGGLCGLLLIAVAFNDEIWGA